MLELLPALALSAAALALAAAAGNALLRARRAGRAAPPASRETEPPPAPATPRQPATRRAEDTLPLTAGAHRRVAARAQSRIEVAEPLLGADAAGAADFYREVADLLQGQLEVTPARLDLRRKLLEVYHAAGEADAFMHCARLYLEHCGSRPDSHWPDVARMGRELLPDHELFAPGAQPRGLARFQRFYESVSQAQLQDALRALAAAYEDARRDPAFTSALQKAMADTLQRPTALTPLPLVSEGAGATVYAKREDGARPDDAQAINALGQTLLAQRLGRSRVVTATQDGVHGLAVASVAAHFGLACTIYMEDAAHRRHYARALQMRRLGATVRALGASSHAEAAWLAALQAWLDDTGESHYVSGLAAGPHPFPAIVRDFQSIVGAEALVQLRASAGPPLRAVVAGIADGYGGLGLLNAFLSDDRVALYCVEMRGPERPRQLREHGWLRASGRVRYVDVTDDEAVDVVETLFGSSGLCVPTEAARTLAYARRIAAAQPDGIVLTLLSRGDERAQPGR